MSHMLTNCLGGQSSAAVEVDVRHEHLQHDDRVLLFTDGLNEVVSDADIEMVLAANPTAAGRMRSVDGPCSERVGAQVTTSRYSLAATSSKPPLSRTGRRLTRRWKQT